MVPGTSRSGATIISGMMAGIQRKTATEFSFFLAMPTMLAATVYDLYRNSGALDDTQLTAIVVGFLAAFVSALVRSEEHTSELQSLMRISYAVFCLKKKQTKTI